MAFIVFEGGDGVGKSTISRLLKEKLEFYGISCLLTREPGGTEVGEKLRNLILDHPFSSRSELLLYQAIRAEHVHCKIKPALENKQWVLCERFTPSSLAYQAAGRKENTEDVLWLNKYASFGLKPDLTILLDLNLEDKEKRVLERKGDLDRFEKEKKDFHERIRNSYLDQSHQKGWIQVSALKKPEEIVEEILNKLKDDKWIPC